ncbi:hypothetical protein QL285_033436 [Trifolium repens]|nr:hypothetical protein QL285_033436 [Trifolium repens]
MARHVPICISKQSSTTTTPHAPSKHIPHTIQRSPRARQPNPSTYCNRDAGDSRWKGLEKRWCGGTPSLIAPPTTWIYIVNLSFGFKGGGGS